MLVSPTRVLIFFNQNILQTFGYIIVILELVFALMATLFLWLPNGPENSSFVLNCLGEDDLIYFEFDYFTPGGYSRKKSYCNFDHILAKYFCQGSLVLLGLVASNILEIFLTSAVMIEMKKSTTSVTNLLTKKSLADRKR